MTKEEIRRGFRMVLLDWYYGGDPAMLEYISESTTDDVRLVEDLGIDSLDVIELIIACEKRFNIHIPDEEAEKTKTVGEAVNKLYDICNHTKRECKQLMIKWED